MVTVSNPCNDSNNLKWLRIALIISTIIVFLLLFFGCTKKVYIEKVKIDSIYIQKVDTSWLQMPADTTFIEIPIDCPDQQIIFKEGKIETRIVLKDKIMTLLRTKPEDSIMIHSLKEEIKKYKETTVDKSKITYKIPFWSIIYMIVSTGVVFLLVWLIIKFKK